MTKTQNEDPNMQNKPSPEKMNNNKDKGETYENSTLEPRSSEIQDTEGLEKSEHEQEEGDLETFINPDELPQDSRTIWAIQRFFLFSVILTVFKIWVYYLSGGDFMSLKAIAIDAALDLAVSGLGIYLIQWQTNIIKKVHKGSQEIKVNSNGAMGIAAIQGLLLFIGGLVIFIQSILKLRMETAYADTGSVGLTNQYSIWSALMLSLIMTVKFYMFFWSQRDAKITQNVALKSFEMNLRIDLITIIATWIMLLLTSFWYYPWIILDAIIGISIGIWMIIQGWKYLYPLIKYLLENEELFEEESEGREKGEKQEKKEDAEKSTLEKDDEQKDKEDKHDKNESRDEKPKTEEDESEELISKLKEKLEENEQLVPLLKTLLNSVNEKDT